MNVDKQLHCYAQGLEAFTVMSFTVTSRSWFARLISVAIIFMNSNVPESMVGSTRRMSCQGVVCRPFYVSPLYKLLPRDCQCGLSVRYLKYLRKYILRKENFCYSFFFFSFFPREVSLFETKRWLRKEEPKAKSSLRTYYKIGKSF